MHVINGNVHDKPMQRVRTPKPINPCTVSLPYIHLSYCLPNKAGARLYTTTQLASKDKNQRKEYRIQNGVAMQ